jgi:hypothetical protein
VAAIEGGADEDCDCVMAERAVDSEHCKIL